MSIAQSLEKASEIVADVGSRAERDGNEQALSLEDRKQLMVAKMLVSYCKRKGGLVLAEKSDADFDRERLMLIVGELVADLQAVGVECASLIETSQILSAATVSVLYDCLYDFAIATLFCEAPVLMIYIHSRAPRQLEMRVGYGMGCAMRPPSGEGRMPFRMRARACRQTTGVSGCCHATR